MEILKKSILGALAFVLMASGSLLGDEIRSGSFKGLNNNESSVIIDPSFASDLLNVDVTPGGKTIKKRSGFGQYKTLPTYKALHGGYHFYDTTGNDVQLWASSTSIYGIVSGATPVQIVSSITLNSTMDCADTQGSAYCVTSGRNAYIRTDGSSLQSWSTSPLGTMVEVTPDRIVVAGVSGTPNSLYFSGSGNYTNFTTGINDTDPFTEVIAAPGSRLTHIRWGCQRLLWWKNTSFGYFAGDNQYNASIVTVSDIVGTLDNSSAVDPGGAVWFRAQDGHIWKYDCSALTKETIEITPLTQVSGSKVQNSWTQTTQSDWQASSMVPVGNFSTTISPGDLTVSSFTRADTISSDFNQGSGSNITYNSTNIVMSTNAVEVPDNSFELETWTSSAIGFYTAGSLATLHCGNPNPYDATWFMSAVVTSSMTISILDSSNATLKTTSINWVSSLCSWTDYSISLSELTRKAIKIKFSFSPGSYTISPLFISNGNTLHFRYMSDDTPGPYNRFLLDYLSGAPNSTIATSTFTSRVFDIGISSSIVQGMANWTVGTFTPYFELQSASNSSTGPWLKITSSSGTSVLANQYVRYLSSFTLGGTDDDLTSVDDVTIIAKSTGGVLLSQVKNAPNFGSWDTFSDTEQNGGGSLTFYTRSASTTYTINSTTPVWVAQPKNSLVTASTGTYMQARADFTTTSATATFSLSDFTFNWFEGTASDQAYGFYFDNAIWWSVAYGAGQSINNYNFKYDLVNDGWTLYNFGNGGMLNQGNKLYFGSTSTGTIYQYGSGYSDDGVAINAYWKTKDFVGSDPWLQNQYNIIDTYAVRNPNEFLTATYTLNNSTTTTSFQISLSSTTQSVVRSNKLLPSGKIGTAFSLKYGDNTTSSAWELLGFRVQYITLPYRPTQ
jgi:hypothetical protein